MKHGLWLLNKATYQVWCDMKARCYNSNCANFKNYGARRIVVCDRWAGSFAAFLNDMGKKPKGLTLDRIDVNGNYTPDNCRWADRRTQRWNMRDVVMIELHGKSQPAEAWAREVGINAETIRRRLRKGLAPDQAVFLPSAQPNKRSTRARTATASEAKP